MALARDQGVFMAGKKCYTASKSEMDVFGTKVAVILKAVTQRQ